MNISVVAIGSIFVIYGIFDYASLIIERHKSNTRIISNKNYSDGNSHVCQVQYLEYLKCLEKTSNDEVANDKEYNEEIIEETKNNSADIDNYDSITSNEKTAEEKENYDKNPLHNIIQRSKITSSDKTEYSIVTVVDNKHNDELKINTFSKGSREKLRPTIINDKSKNSNGLKNINHIITKKTLTVLAIFKGYEIFISNGH